MPKWCREQQYTTIYTPYPSDAAVAYHQSLGDEGIVELVDDGGGNSNSSRKNKGSLNSNLTIHQTSIPIANRLNRNKLIYKHDNI